MLSMQSVLMHKHSTYGMEMTLQKDFIRYVEMFRGLPIEHPSVLLFCFDRSWKSI